MSIRERNPGVESVGDKLAVVLDSVCRLLIFVGAICTIVGVAFLIVNYSNSSTAAGTMLKQAQQNVGLFGTMALVGTALLALSLSFVNWGEEVLGPLLLIAWAVFFFSPMYLPPMLGGGSGETTLGKSAMTAMQTASIPFGSVGLIVVVADIIVRSRTRAREGAKADQLKLGKGLKEEKDIRNVFMGKCWQLPYCRKFVRERCPIFHARRTCWKEQVGCMCEESVIRNAMEGRVIPADAVAAAKFIPENRKLTPQQKSERCRSCVIYNEHQKHKYKLAMPTMILAFGAVYAVFRPQMVSGIQGAMSGINKFVGSATLSQDGGKDLTKTGLGSGDVPFAEIIVVALLVVALAYMIRLVEYLLFKAKI